MRKLGAVAAIFLLVAAGCAAGKNERTILLDYSGDEFSANFLEFFPRKVAVAPGAELVFRQTWTGEAHSVTGGTLVNNLMKKVEPFIDRMYAGEALPDEPPPEIAKLEATVPPAVPEEGNDMNQAAAQPCYIAKGATPSDPRPPCKNQKQPVFNGTQSYYNSGLIPYEGPQGNEYRVKLADNIKPGDYWFYCNYHGETQSTKVTVGTAGAKAPSQQDVNVSARRQIRQQISPMAKILKEAREKGRVNVAYAGKQLEVKGPFAGLFADDLSVQGAVDEFVPNRLTVKAGEKITWKWFGGHTISFGVPRYFPIVTIAKNGKVAFNPKLMPEAGGAKPFVYEEGPPDPDNMEPLRQDGGTYDGTGFWSSGLSYGGFGAPYIEYTMRISKPGTYEYACLIHPPMVGKIIVK